MMQALLEPLRHVAQTCIQHSLTTHAGSMRIMQSENHDTYLVPASDDAAHTSLILERLLPFVLGAPEQKHQDQGAAADNAS